MQNRLASICDLANLGAFTMLSKEGAADSPHPMVSILATYQEGEGLMRFTKLIRRFQVRTIMEPLREHIVKLRCF